MLALTIEPGRSSEEQLANEATREQERVASGDDVIVGTATT